MNKKLNTIFFILGATLFNVLTTIVCFVLLIFIYIRFLYNLIPEQYSSWGFSIIFIASLAISFVAYRFLLKYLLKKIDIEKYFDPIFVRRNFKKPGA